MVSLERKVLIWIATGKVGLSSKAMAMAACGVQCPGNHPRDAGDFQRCLLLLDAIPEIRQHFNEIAGLSPVWNRLIEDWDAIEECFLEEAGLHWSDGGDAPKTYAALTHARQMVENGEHHVR